MLIHVIYLSLLYLNCINILLILWLIDDMTVINGYISDNSFLIQLITEVWAYDQLL